MDEFKAIIKKENLENIIYPVGAYDNPIPYYREADVFFLPSRHEGKPMAVTESFIMGAVPVVTEYTSAKEQIQNKTDGLIFDNDDEALYEGLKDLLKNPDILKELKTNISNSDYGNEKEISEFYKMADKLLHQA